MRVEMTKQRHRDIYAGLRAGDAEQASAADVLHLADGERWLQRRLARGQTLREPEGPDNGTQTVAPRANGSRHASGGTTPISDAS